MKIPCTDLQALEFECCPWLHYRGGTWYWETEQDRWPASNNQVQDAMLERILVLESELLDLRHRQTALTGLEQALHAQQLLQALHQHEFIIPIEDKNNE